MAVTTPAPAAASGPAAPAPITSTDAATELHTLELPDGHQVLVASAGQGPSVLYLHGLCDVHSVVAPDRLTPFLSTLAGQARVVCPALPGYPGSDPLGRLHDMEDYIFHVSDLVRTLGLDDGSLVAVGHSIGGWLAAELALRHPELLSHLVLLAPLGLHVPGLVIPPVFGPLAPRGLGGFGEPRRLLFADPEGAPAVEALPDAMAVEQQLRWFSGLAGAAALGWKAPQFQSRRLAARLRRITTPTLVVCGKQDLLVPEATRRSWVETMPDARLVEVSDTGHALALERPAVAGEVVGFLGWL